MNNPFFNKSKAIANDFLQSIVFIDDRAYLARSEGSPNQDFDARKVSNVFASEKKICGVYQPQSQQDIDNFKGIAKKADVVILDWQINLLNEEEGKNPEDDAKDDDVRGQFTLEIINEILRDPIVGKDSLKLIIIYTGEIDLMGITQEVYDVLLPECPKLILEECKVYSENIKILIRAKSSVGDNEEDTKFNHLLALKDKIVKYKDLPSFVLDEFTEMTSGLLSNFALQSLTTIRFNSHKILSLFSKELDCAYLSHKSFVPNSEDAEDLLLDILKDTIADLLSYNGTHRIINKDLISDWIDVNIVEEAHSVLSNKGNKLNPGVDFDRKKSMLTDLLFSKETKVEKKFETVFKALIQNKELRIEFLKYLSNNNTKLFLNLSNLIKEEEINKNFAKLTHHKSLFLPQNIEPKLTLGTIIKSTKNDNYFICIQQKCDSVRIYGTERKFLFLPMSIIEGNDKFEIISPTGIKLKLNKKSFSIRTIKFLGDTQEGIVKGKNNGFGKYIFEQNYKEETDEHFEWILDLKDLHSQRIVVEYASQLSRVGLDESEWLRRWAN
jgi:uncharacterized protein YutE (UPF0331/DUF86 family)